MLYASVVNICFIESTSFEDGFAFAVHEWVLYLWGMLLFLLFKDYFVFLFRTEQFKKFQCCVQKLFPSNTDIHFHHFVEDRNEIFVFCKFLSIFAQTNVFTIKLLMWCIRQIGENLIDPLFFQNRNQIVWVV